MNRKRNGVRINNSFGVCMTLGVVVGILFQVLIGAIGAFLVVREIISEDGVGLVALIGRFIAVLLGVSIGMNNSEKRVFSGAGVVGILLLLWLSMDILVWNGGLDGIVLGLISCMLAFGVALLLNMRSPKNRGARYKKSRYR